MTAALECLVVGPCKDCGRQMLQQPDYWRHPDLRERGFVRHGGHNLCATDYSRARRAGTLPNPAPAGRRARLTRVPPRPPINPAIVAQLRAAAGLPPLGRRRAAVPA